MTSQPTDDPGTLLRGVQAGDRSSFDELLRRSEPRLLRLVRARMGSVLRGFEESSDLARSAMVEAMRTLPRFQYTGPGSFLRWLSTLVENKIRHHLRDLKRARRDPARLAAESPTRDGRAAPASRGDRGPLEAALSRRELAHGGRWRRGRDGVGASVDRTPGCAQHGGLGFQASDVADATDATGAG